MSDKIIEALKKLDPSNANHWTADKLARLETVKLLAADQSITRDEIERVAPGYSKDTAAGYWLTYTAPADSAAGAATGPAGATEGAGQGGSGSPQGQGAGAETQAATQAEGTEASSGTEGADGSGTDAPGAPEQSALEDTGSGVENDLKALEAELEATQNAIAERRLKVDELKDEIDSLAAHENAVYDKIQAFKSTGNSNAEAIQGYLAQQRKNLEERAARMQLIRESGLDLSQLAADLKSPLDAAMARKTGRGGQRPQW